MLDKDTFFEKFDELVTAYPSWKLDFGNARVVKFWYSKFEDMESGHFIHMVDSYIEKERFNPTIAGLREHDTLPRKTRDQIEHEKMLKEHGML